MGDGALAAPVQLVLGKDPGVVYTLSSRDYVGGANGMSWQEMPVGKH
jgi:hypothetical protein